MNELIVGFSLLGIVVCVLIYRDMKQLYDKLDYLVEREDVEIEMAFLAGARWRELNPNE